MRRPVGLGAGVPEIGRTGSSFRNGSSVSRPARGFTRQEAFLCWKVWSRHAWLQAMQVLIRSGDPACALSAQSGSARNGRAMLTRSAWPSARICSAVWGMLIRFEAATGTDTTSLTRRVKSTNAARGTEVTMVGTRASCQPMPVLSRSTPAVSSARARSRVSSRV